MNLPKNVYPSQSPVFPYVAYLRGRAWKIRKTQRRGIWRGFAVCTVSTDQWLAYEAPTLKCLAEMMKGDPNATESR